MKKKLLSALLALVMVLSLLPTTAFAAAEQGDIISYVTFAYTHPPVMADDWGVTDDDFDTLRNVFVVGLQTRVDPWTTDPQRNNFTVAVKAGGKNDSGNYEAVDTYNYSGSGASTVSGSSGAIYFKAPKDVLTSGTNTYTVKVTNTKTKEYQVKEITLVEIHLYANAGGNLEQGNFDSADGIIQSDVGYSIFAPQNKQVVFLPTLKNGEAGGGQVGEEFVGWATDKDKNSGGTYISTGKDETEDRTVYAVFGVKPVQDFVLSEKLPSAWEVGKAPESKLAFEKEIAYGAEPAENAINIYIVNTGNQTLGSKEQGDKGFYTMTKSTDHFKIDFEIPGDYTGKAGAVPGNEGKYWLGAGENEGKSKDEIELSNAPYIILKCTPNETLSAGTYTDTIKLDNPLSRITQIQLKLTVKPTEVTLKMGEISKKYGQIVSLDNNGQWQKSEGGPTAAPTITGKEGLTYSELIEKGLVLDNVGFSSGASVKTEQYNYEVKTQPANYNVTVTGGITVGKATPTGNASVTATAIRVGDDLSKSTLSGIFSNPYNDAKVDGELKWDENNDVFSSKPAQEDGYDANWTFTPTDQTNYTTVNGTVKVKVLAKTPTTLHRNTNGQYAETVTYNGQMHEAKAYVTYKDNTQQNKETTLEGAVVKYAYRLHQSDHSGAEDTGGSWTSINADGTNWPKDAGTWDIRATYEGEGDYAPVSQIFHLTIEPKPVNLMVVSSITKTYDGKKSIDSNISFQIYDGAVAGESLKVGEGYTAAFDDPNAGEGKSVTITGITLASGNDAATNPANYKVPNDGMLRHTGTINPKTITLRVKDDVTLSKYYGETFTGFEKHNFTAVEANGFVEGEGMDNLDVTFSSEGTATDADAKEYNITATLNEGGNYKLSSNAVTGKFVVNKAALTNDCIQQQPSSNAGYKGGPKSEVKIIEGVVKNPHNEDMTVAGTWVWTTGTTGKFGQEESEETFEWKFTPKDTTNYTGELTGEVTVPVLNEKQIEIEVPANILTVPYNGEVQVIDVTKITTEPKADVTVSYVPENPTNAGEYQVFITATPEAGSETDKTYGVTEVPRTLTITKAPVNVTEPTLSAKEGKPLPTITVPGTTFTGVNNTQLEGTFKWTNSAATVKELTENFEWSFEPEDTTNYVTPVTGTFTVTMAADDRTVDATVYNLPENDYAVVTIGEGDSALKPGEMVTFYSDETCNDPVSETAVVPDGNNGKFTVDLDTGALAKEAGTIYAKIGGKMTQTTEVKYKAELGFTLPNNMVLLHVGGSNQDKTEEISVVFSDSSYKNLMTADTWTVTGGANLVEITNSQEADGAATFRALAAGTTTVTVTITFKHPDTVNHSNDTIPVTVTVPLNITTHYVVFTDTTVENGTCTADPTEADENDTINVTLKPNPGYQSSGLNVYYRSAEGTPDEQHKVTATGSGNNYTFTMPESDVVLVPEFTQIPSGGGSFGGGGAGGGASGPSTAPETDNVITPEVTADASGEAKAPVDAAEVESAVESAKQSGADEIVVEPQVTGDADKVSVELDKKSVDAMADSSDLDLTVKTDAANVTLPGDSLDELADKTGSKVTVSVEEKTGGEVGIEVAIDGKPVETLSGGLKVDLPKASGGNVLVIVGADGSETIVKKSIVENGHAYAVLDGSCSVKIVDNSITFADVASADWYSNAVDFASSHELFKGVGHNNFAPNSEMTRAMVATVLWRFESGEHVDAAGTFADVAEGEWYTDGIAWASEHNIITGYTSGTFGPQDNVTREQLATMLYRYAKDIGMNVSTSGSLSKFSDSGEVSAYAQDALRWAVGVGLIKGNPNNTINPDGYAKRSEVATIFMRFCELITK